MRGENRRGLQRRLEVLQKRAGVVERWMPGSKIGPVKVEFCGQHGQKAKIQTVDMIVAFERSPEAGATAVAGAVDDAGTVSWREGEVVHRGFGDGGLVLRAMRRVNRDGSLFRVRDEVKGGAGVAQTEGFARGACEKAEFLVARERNPRPEQNLKQSVGVYEVAGIDVLETALCVLDGGLVADFVSPGLAD